MALGLKSLETRTHTRFAHLAGQDIAIHAGKRIDKDAPENVAIAIARSLQAELFALDVFGCEWLDRLHDDPRLYAEGIVAVSNCGPTERMRPSHVANALCEWGSDLYVTHLHPVEQLDTPIPCRGFQGAWTMPADVAARVAARVALPILPF